MADITVEAQAAPGGTQGAESAELLIQLCGAWSATIELADPDQRDWKDVAVRVLWLGQELLGVVESQAVAEGKATVFVVGGAGKLAASAPAKHYQNSTPQLIASDACQAAGEQLATDRLPPTSLFQFPRRNAPLDEVLDDLARAIGCLWGVYPSGKVWLGAPAWEAAADFDADELDADDIYQYTDFQVRAFGPLPGQTYNGQRIGCARYTLDAKHDTRLRIWFQVGDLDLDNDALRTGLATFIRKTQPLVWLGKYPGGVRAVRSNGTWDVELDEKRLPPLVGVRPRVFAPGAKIVPPNGSRVEVSFEQNDPRYPVAELFEGGAAQHALVIDGDEVDVGTLVLTGGAMTPIGGTYTDPFGTATTVVPGSPIHLKGKAKSSQTKVYL